MTAIIHHQNLHVEGIRCARCIHAIESALQKEPSIASARVNMSTSRLALSWQGDQSLLNEYLRIIESLGYKAKPCTETKTDRSESDQLLRAMAVAGFAMGNIMLLSVALWSSKQNIMGFATRDLFHLLSGAIAIPTILYAGRPFFSSAFSVLKHGRTNMDVPISLALILACGMSLFETLNHGEHAYFDSAVMLLFFLLVGRWLDARARGKARESAENLLSLMQGMATILEDGTPRLIPINELREGMLLNIAAGENIPTDAIVESGSSQIDTSLVTGESIPRDVKIGDTLYGGTLNLSAALTARVTKASEDSLLADIIRLMEQAEQGRARYVRLADKAAQLYTPLVHSLAAAAFLGWFFLGGLPWQDALLIAITTLIITCPCALGLAVPVVQVLASSWLMKRGILVKSGDALERLSRIDTIVFDKTGTLTTNHLQLEHAQSDISQFAVAASLAAHSRHPLAKALAVAYHGALLPMQEIAEHAGCGIEAHYQGQLVRLGKASWAAPHAESSGDRPEIWLNMENKSPIGFTFQDTLKKDAHSTIQHLSRHQLMILSGDREPSVASVASALGIGDYHAQCLPADKVSIITQLRSEKHEVLMVGDGLNDAPALSAASISMSPATAMDITQNSADMVFQGETLAPVLWAWQMACFSTQLVKQNFTLAVIYNFLAIPLAVAGYVTPLIAAVAMSSSSLIVILNSFRINLKQGR